MGLLMDRIVSRYPKDDQLKNNIKTSLRAIEKKCRWTGGQWEELGMNWNDIQALFRAPHASYLVQIDYVASGGKIKFIFADSMNQLTGPLTINDRSSLNVNLTGMIATRMRC